MAPTHHYIDVSGSVAQTVSGMPGEEVKSASRSPASACAVIGIFIFSRVNLNK